MECVQIGTNQWETKTPIDKSILGKVGVAVCDSLGNQTTRFINYLPDDIFVDNNDEGYLEINGS
jgi:hypothetical protein